MQLPIRRKPLQKRGSLYWVHQRRRERRGVENLTTGRSAPVVAAPSSCAFHPLISAPLREIPFPGCERLLSSTISRGRFPAATPRGTLVPM